MSYFVFCFSPCVCTFATWTPEFAVYQLVFIVHVQSVKISKLPYMMVCACVCVCISVCGRETVFPGLLVIMFLGVMGGTWKPCAAQIKTNKEMMGAPLSPLWPGGPRGARTGRLRREGTGRRERRREGGVEEEDLGGCRGAGWLPLWFVKNALPPKSNGKLLLWSKTHRAEKMEWTVDGWGGRRFSGFSLVNTMEDGSGKEDSPVQVAQSKKGESMYINI